MSMTCAQVFRAPNTLLFAPVLGPVGDVNTGVVFGLQKNLGDLPGPFGPTT